MVQLNHAKMNDIISVYIRLNEGAVKPEIWACNDNTLIYGPIDETLDLNDVDNMHRRSNFMQKCHDGYFFAGSLQIRKLIKQDWTAFLNFWLGDTVSDSTIEIMQNDGGLRSIADEICRNDPLAESNPDGCKSALLRKRMALLRSNDVALVLTST